MAETGSTSTYNTVTELETIVDADAHLTESVGDYLPYMDEKYEVIRRKIESTDAARTVFSATMTAPGDHTHYGGGTADLNSKLGNIREFGLDKAVLSPSRTLGINTVNDPDFAMALANAYNSWVLDEFVDQANQLYAKIVVSPKKPDKAAEEIDDRAKEDGFVGVLLPPGGLIPPAGHPMYDPIYGAAEDNGLPVTHHGTITAMRQHFPVLAQWLEKYAEDALFGHPFEIITAFGTSMTRGVPERFPDLDLVFDEGGIGWVPEFMGRLDDQYMTRGEEMPHLDKLPSEYVGEQVHFTTQPILPTHGNHEFIVALFEMIGIDGVMYSADLPHPTFDPPEELFDQISTMDREQVSQIMAGNAVDLYGL